MWPMSSVILIVLLLSTGGFWFVLRRRRLSPLSEPENKPHHGIDGDDEGER